LEKSPKKMGLRYKRLLLKLSGEALLGEKEFGIDPSVLSYIAEEIEDAINLGVEIAVVVGGGNFFRGINSSEIGIDRIWGDYMGMLATLINGIALQNYLEKRKITTRLVSALEIRAIAEPFIPKRAMRHLEKGRVVIFACGTGNPFFSTDTAAALRAIEMKADVLLKATKVEGIFSSDPMKDKNSRMFRKLTYFQVLEKGLRVMDTTAITLCMENNMPIIVFNIKGKGNLRKIIKGEEVGTIVT